MDRDPRLANLQRAVGLPWTDGGRCVVQEASQPWPILAERCYHALEHDRIEFHDTTGRCSVASMGAAAVEFGACVLAAPEVIAGAVIVTGMVVVAFAIKEAIDVYELKRGYPQVRPLPETRPVPEATPVLQEPAPKQRPKPEPKGPDLPPPGPTETTEKGRRPECEPFPVKHRGGNDAHNKCADGIPFNSFPGWDVRVNGKDYDGLQFAVRTLWDVKTDDFEQQLPRSQDFFVRGKLPELKRERALAEACRYDFVIGVRSRAHKQALFRADPTLKVVIMDWC